MSALLPQPAHIQYWRHCAALLLWLCRCGAVYRHRSLCRLSHAPSTSHHFRAIGYLLYFGPYLGDGRNTDLHCLGRVRLPERIQPHDCTRMCCLKLRAYRSCAEFVSLLLRQLRPVDAAFHRFAHLDSSCDYWPVRSCVPSTGGAPLLHPCRIYLIGALRTVRTGAGFSDNFKGSHTNLQGGIIGVLMMTANIAWTLQLDDRISHVIAYTTSLVNPCIYMVFTKALRQQLVNYLFCSKQAMVIRRVGPLMTVPRIRSGDAITSNTEPGDNQWRASAAHGCTKCGVIAFATTQQ